MPLQSLTWPPVSFHLIMWKQHISENTLFKISALLHCIEHIAWKGNSELCNSGDVFVFKGTIFLFLGTHRFNYSRVHSGAICFVRVTGIQSFFPPTLSSICQNMFLSIDNRSPNLLTEFSICELMEDFFESLGCKNSKEPPKTIHYRGRKC